MIIIFVVFIDHLIDYPINRASLTKHSLPEEPKEGKIRSKQWQGTDWKEIRNKQWQDEMALCNCWQTEKTCNKKNMVLERSAEVIAGDLN